MSEQSNADHWGELAASMGVSPSEAAPPREGSRALDPVKKSPPAPRAAKPAGSAGPRRPAADWGRLAADLGIEGPVEPTPQAISDSTLGTATPSDASLAAEAALEVVSVEAEAAERARAEALESEFTELSDPLLLDLPGTPAAESNLSLDESEPVSVDQPPDWRAENSDSAKRDDDSSEGRKSGRRRRRGRRRGRRPPEAEAASASVQHGRRSESDVEPPRDSDQGELAEAEKAAAGEEGELPRGRGEPGSEDQRRGRRRRRRRDGSRRRSETAEDRPTTHQPPEEAETGPEPLSAEELGDDDDFDKEAHISHRAIPTWQEAVELVIARNMESRAKHPKSGPPPRNHGRSRPRDRS